MRLLRSVVLKLGGSLVTDKSKPMTARLDVIERVSKEIREALEISRIDLVLIHGGGSFGHYYASKVLSERGSIDSEGFAQIAWSMNELSRLIVSKLIENRVSAVQISTRGVVYEEENEVHVYIDSIRRLMSRNLVPVLFGDVIVSNQGFRIISGDELAWRIALELGSEWVLFATNVEGVYDKPPEKGGGEVIKRLRLSEIDRMSIDLENTSRGIDVTGGMLQKILSGEKALARGVKGHVFSGLIPGNIYRALVGDRDFGTVIEY